MNVLFLQLIDLGGGHLAAVGSEFAVGFRADRDDLFVGVAMHPFMQVLAPNRPYVKVLDERALPLSIGNRRPWLLAEIDMTKPGGGWFFRRPHDQLWSIARRHYFDVALEPVAKQAQFVSGWYQAERSDTDEWRWMSGHSVTRLPAASGETVLRLEGNFPAELLPRKPNVTIVLNGDILDRFVPAAEHWQRMVLASLPWWMKMHFGRALFCDHTEATPVWVIWQSLMESAGADDN